MPVTAEGPRAVVLRGDDTVAVAARPMPRGFLLELGGPHGRGPRADRAGAQGRSGRHRHRASPCGSTARSSASPRRPIAAGSLVHVHNLKADLFERDYAFATEQPAPSPAGPATDVSAATCGPTAGSARGITSP